MTLPEKSTEAALAYPPSPETVRALRMSYGLTQREAAKLIYVSHQSWSNFETGNSPISRANWELFNLKLRNLPPK